MFSVRSHIRVFLYVHKPRPDQLVFINVWVLASLFYFCIYSYSVNESARIPSDSPSAHRTNMKTKETEWVSVHINADFFTVWRVPRSPMAIVSRFEPSPHCLTPNCEVRNESGRVQWTWPPGLNHKTSKENQARFEKRRGEKQKVKIVRCRKLAWVPSRIELEITSISNHSVYHYKMK